MVKVTPERLRQFKAIQVAIRCLWRMEVDKYPLVANGSKQARDLLQRLRLLSESAAAATRGRAGPVLDWFKTWLREARELRSAIRELHRDGLSDQ